MACDSETVYLKSYVSSRLNEIFMFILWKIVTFVYVFMVTYKHFSSQKHDDNFHINSQKNVLNWF